MSHISATKTLDTEPCDGVTAEHALSGARPLECGSHSGPRWYVVQTHRGAEALAVAELGNQSFPTLLPLRRIEPDRADPDAPRRHRKRHDMPRFAVAFPGYLFVLFDRRERQWRAIHSTRGVKRLFSHDAERPIPVPVGVVERLMAALSKNLIPALPTDSDDPVPEGSIVTVMAEPFARQEAVCTRSVLRGGCVRVRLLGSGWDAEIPRPDVVVVGG